MKALTLFTSVLLAAAPALAQVAPAPQTVKQTTAMYAIELARVSVLCDLYLSGALQLKYAKHYADRVLKPYSEYIRSEIGGTLLQAHSAPDAYRCSALFSN